MTSEQFIVLVILIVIIVVAIMQVSKNRRRIKRAILNRFNVKTEARQQRPHEPEQPFTESEPRVMTAEESKVELERLQKLIEDRKQIAMDTDISHHLWGLYTSLLRYTSPHSLTTKKSRVGGRSWNSSVCFFMMIQIAASSKYPWNWMWIALGAGTPYHQVGQKPFYLVPGSTISST